MSLAVLPVVLCGYCSRLFVLTLVSWKINLIGKGPRLHPVNLLQKLASEQVLIQIQYSGTAQHNTTGTCKT